MIVKDQIIKMNYIEKVLQESGKYLTEPVALLTDQSKDPVSVSDKIIIRQNNCIILLLVEILRKQDESKEIDELSNLVKGLSLNNSGKEKVEPKVNKPMSKYRVWRN